jgi:hypothetical protein
MAENLDIMDNRVTRTERLLNIFNENKVIDGFRTIVGHMKREGIKLSSIYDRNGGPAYFQTTRLSNGVVKRRLCANMAYSNEAIRIGLDHEGTHAQQSLVKLAIDIQKYDLKSQLCIDILSEVHAFSNQCEFAIQRYFKKLEEGDVEGSFEEKAFDGFFKKNGVTGRDSLIAYIYGMQGDVVTIQSHEDVRDALKYYYHNHIARGNNPEKDMINGRKAVLKDFFDTVPVYLGGRHTTFKANNNVLEGYIKNSIDYYTRYPAQIGRNEMPLDAAAMIYMTNGDLFLQPEDYEEVLGIETCHDICDLALQGSKYKKTFSSLLANSVQQNPDEVFSELFR